MASNNSLNVTCKHRCNITRDNLLNQAEIKFTSCKHNCNVVRDNGLANCEKRNCSNRVVCENNVLTNYNNCRQSCSRQLRIRENAIINQIYRLCRQNCNSRFCV